MTHDDPQNPERIFKVINGYQLGRALEAAIRLDLFTQLGTAKLTAKELAERLGTSERGTRILCDFLCLSDFLEKEGSAYRQTEESSFFLDRSSDAFMGSITEFLLASQLVDSFKDLEQAVRKGGTIIGPEGTMAPEHPLWIKYARGMAPLAAPAANFMAEIAELSQDRPQRVLDIAAGHGIFGITFAKRYPRAEVVALDWEPVLHVAEQNAGESGVSDRFHRISGSAFTVDYGGFYDVVLATNFFHHFDPATCEKLMGRMREALKPGGKVITLEFVPDEDRLKPAPAAGFPLIMLATTEHGDAYTFAQYDAMFRAAGFTKNVFHQVEKAPQDVIVSTV